MGSAEDTVAAEMAADCVERGDPLAGHQGQVDPGHLQRPAVCDQQVQIGRTA
jgi:hypothetical protein